MRRLWGLGCTVLASVGCVVTWFACSAPSKGGLVLSITTDMQAPKDIDVVSLYITSNGAPKFDYLGRVLPDGTVELPATLAIVEPDTPGAQIRVRVTAFKSQPDGSAKARVLRDVVTTVPHQRVGLLRVPLSFLDDGSAQGTLPSTLTPGQRTGVPDGDTTYDPTTPISSAPGYLTTTCDFTSGKTSVNGACVDSSVDSSTLPAYDGSLVFGDGGPLATGEPASCFDVAACFGGATPVAGLDTTHCTFTTSVPAAQLDLALLTASTGACTAAGQCYVPLQNDPSEGWTMSNGTVTLPAGVCTKITQGARLVQGVGGRCGSLTPTEPICQPATAVPDASTADVGVRDAGCTTDAGVPASLCGSTCVDLTSDRSNCGYCGHGCQGGACTASSCQPIVLSPVEHIPWGIAVQSGTVYWLEQDSNYHIIHSVPAGGGTVMTVYARTPAMNDPTEPENDLVVDSTRVYFGSPADIVSVPLDGGTATVLSQNNEWPLGMAVDTANVYWATPGPCPHPPDGGTCQPGFIYQTAKDGTGTPIPLAAGELGPASVAVLGSTVYWVSDGAGDGTNSGVVRSTPVGGGPVTTLASGLPMKYNLNDNTAGYAAMGVDSTGVYFTTYDGMQTGAVMKVPLDGGAPVTLMSATNPQKLAVDSTGVYVSQGFPSSIAKIPLDGGPPVTVATTTTYQPWTIALDPNTVYFTSFGCPTDGGECSGQVMQVAKP
jgi:hypothetical protein